MSASASPSSGRSAAVAVLAVTLAVFAAFVAYVSFWLRAGLREQILRREAATLTEVASMQLANEAETLAALGVADAPGELLNAVLKTSKLRGVFAVRVFDASKHFNGALPIPWSESPPPARDWTRLTAGQPIARLHDRESAAEVIGLAPAVPVGGRAEPLLETWLPLRRAVGAPFAGAAQMWTDGHSIATEFQSLDHHVLIQALLAWCAGAGIITALFSWAFRRLALANQQLQARSEDLLRANRELTLAAKTSALGAVTAHLMHELKNPVAGLEEFVASQSEAGARSDNGGELAAATELTRRLRTIINDVVAVIRDDQSGGHFELTPTEMAELAISKATPLANARGVRLQSKATGVTPLDARRANLVVMVLSNLLQNAIEATPSGGLVTLTGEGEGDEMSFLVADQGGGLSEIVRARLFQPVPSSKRGGSGLGLALSQQLARQARGRLELVRSNADGTCFRMAIQLSAET